MGRPSLILIDTHVWIWFHSAPERMSFATRNRLESEDRVAISSISIYETMVAIEKGRITSGFQPEPLVRRWLKSASFIRFPVTEEIVIQSRILKFQHADPFDRLIAGTAVHENVPLVTADRNLLELNWLETIEAQ